MRRLVLLAAAILLMGAGLSTASSEAAGPPPGQVTVIQAVPGAEVTVTVDGRVMTRDAPVGTILGPFELAPGTHDIDFSATGVDVASSVEVSAGDVSDVVVHLPAETGGEPVVHSYRAPMRAIGPGKARVLLAHTATVAPADVQVDGQTVFTNIANGEFADADVPAGTIEVALLPSGTTGDPILGPIDVPLRASTLSMVYAYGNPRNGSMNVISHTTTLGPDGSVRPTRIDTGAAGLVAGHVTSFTDARPSAPGRRLWWLAALAAPCLAGALGLRRRRIRPPAAAG